MAEAAHAVSADTSQRSRYPNTFAAVEIAAALTYTRRKAENELRKALRLTRDLPEVHAALGTGAIDDHKAHVIAEAASALPAASAGSAAGKILRSAARLTVGQVKAEMGRLCIEEDPGYAQTRYEQRLDRRRLVVDPTSAGTAEVSIRDCAPDLAHTANLRVNILANGLKRAGSTRSHTQLRADVALDLLTGRNADLYADAGGGKAGSVTLHVACPAANCDLDHRIDHPRGGPTTVENRLGRCRHRAKHEGGWGYIKTGRVTVEWASPFDLTYQTGGNQTGGRSPP